jgi:hypothetical protein
MSNLNKSTEKTNKVSFNDQKEKYLSNCHSFALSLVQLLDDRSASRLYCPNFKYSGNACACLQKYVIGIDNNLDDKHNRAKHLFNILKKAKQLSRQKSYSTINGKGIERIGLGNGQKKSKEFEKFVNIHRNYLRKELNFCEKAAQKVLFYSNNFLHKSLKTEPNNRRVERQKGKAATGKLIDIKLLINENCCKDQCVKMAETHFYLLDNWRQRAAISQSEARRVLSEMLTPTQGIRTNCYKFISLVTGTSLRTITSVNQHMRNSGGMREPLEHGLKKYWQQNNKRSLINTNTNVSHDQSIDTNKELNKSTQNSLYMQISNDYNNDNNVVQQNTIHLLIAKTGSNQEFSVINNATESHSIAVLNSQINIIDNDQRVQSIPLPITSLQLL